MKKTIIAVVIIAFLALVLGGTYNSMVKKSQAVDGQWAQVQNVYQRRADLIPNLVATVSGAANFEKSTLTEVTDARASVGQVKLNASQAPTDPAQLAAFEKAQDGLTSALSRLLVVSEAYPSLKATTNFVDLQAQLEGTENRITVERQKFNSVVQTYDTGVKVFPGVLFAGLFGFAVKPYFTAQSGASAPPTVSFSFGAAPAPAAKP